MQDCSHETALHFVFTSYHNRTIESRDMVERWPTLSSHLKTTQRTGLPTVAENVTITFLRRNFNARLQLNQLSQTDSKYAVR